MCSWKGRSVQWMLNTSINNFYYLQPINLQIRNKKRLIQSAFKNSMTTSLPNLLCFWWLMKSIRLFLKLYLRIWSLIKRVKKANQKDNYDLYIENIFSKNEKYQIVVNRILKKLCLVQASLFSFRLSSSFS